MRSRFQGVRSPCLRSALVGLLGLWLAASAAAAGVDPRWWRGVSREIENSEYSLSWQPARGIPGVSMAWQAANREQGLRTYFLEQGIRVQPREDAGAPWSWGLTLVGYHGEGASRPVEAATLVAELRSARYERGDVIEWYSNGPRGVEQGFTLATPPPGTSAFAVVRLDLALDTGLLPMRTPDGQVVDFAGADGRRVLRYAGLAARDARGRELPSRIDGSSSDGFPALQWVVEPGEGIYPITLSVLVSGAAWAVEGNQSGSGFGASVAPAGDVNGDGYGDLIVGAPRYDNGQSNEGRVYVYYGSASGPSALPAWQAESNQAEAWFGLGVAPAGDVNGDGYADIAVGEPLFDHDQTDEGRVCVYYGSAAGLSATPSWTAEGNQAGTRFGFSVASAGSVNGDGYADLLVGAPFHDNGQKDEGRAYLYLGSAAGLSATPAWTAESNQVGARYGNAVASAGDVNGDGYDDAIVGAYFYDNGQKDEGRVVVYRGSAAGTLVPIWTAEGNQASGRFGNAVATAGDVNGDGYADVVVGANLFDNDQADEGRVFLYSGSATGLSSTPAWTAEGNQTAAGFGGALAPAGDVNGDGYGDLLVGADGFGTGQAAEGRVFLYQGSATGLGSSPTWTAEGNQAAGRFGVSVATAGDVNGDGYSDLVVGADVYDGDLPDEGRVSVYYGAPAGLTTVPEWSFEGDQYDAELGWAVDGAGDVNGDGYDDVVVGCPQCENVPTPPGEGNEGWALVYKGSPAGLSSTPAWILESGQGFSGYGRDVASAGDLNGDGYGDLVVGASVWDKSVPPGGPPSTSPLAEGKVFVYYGSPSGPHATPDWTVVGDEPDALFGKEVGSAGDVNGDGYSDLIFSATDFSVVFPPSGTTTGKGRVFVYHGSATGLSTTPAWSAEATPNDVGNPQLDAHFGYGARGAGDVNGDGYSDVIIGAPDYDNPDPIEGRAYLYYGSAAGLSTTPNWSFEANQSGAYLGIDVQGVGDFNGDGYADVIIGSDGYGKTPPFGNDPLDNVGRVWFFPGSPTGLGTAPAGYFESGQDSAQAGVNVAAAGDVNGDGFADILFGSRRWDDAVDPVNFKDEGKAWILMGNDGGGLPVKPQQRRVDNAGQIAQGQMSDSSNGFRVSLLGRSPFGRGRVKLEWEVKPYGTPFDGTGTQISATWVDTGLSGVTLSKLASGLAPNTPYHWRARVRYDPATTPFQHAGRWIAPPRNGAQETDLRTAP